MENVTCEKIEKMTPDMVCKEIYEYLAFLDAGGKPRLGADELHVWLGHLLYTLIDDYE